MKNFSLNKEGWFCLINYSISIINWSFTDFMELSINRKTDYSPSDDDEMIEYFKNVYYYTLDDQTKADLIEIAKKLER